MKYSIILYLGLPFISLSGMGYYPPAGARAISMGGSGLMLADIFSPVNNCALMPQMKKPGIGFSFTNRYTLQDVNQVAISAYLPYKRIAYGFKLLSNGNNTLSDRTVGLCFAHSPIKQLNFGIAANFHHFRIIGYGNASVVTMEFSLFVIHNEKLSSSFHVFNPFTAQLKNTPSESIQRTFRLGILYKNNNKVSMICEAEKIHTFKTNIKMGCQYQLNPEFYFSIGFSSLQPCFTFGIGFKKHHSIIAFASSVMQSPGSSNNLSFMYEIGK